MIKVDNIHPLSDFQRNAKSHIERLKKSGQPHVLTVNGKAELIVQDAKAYEQMLALLDEADAIAGIREGLDQLDRGEGRPAGEVLARLRKRIKRRSGKAGVK